MTENTVPGRRGRPRSARSRQAVLDAAADILMEGGMTSFTMEAVATRARVSKATLYKWWPSRSAVAIDGFFARVQETVAIAESLPTEQALLFQVNAVRELFAEDACGPLMRSLVGQAQSDPDIRDALRDRWLAPRREVTERILREAIAAGRVRPDIDLPLTIDQLFAPLYYRMIFGHEPLTEDFCQRLVAQVMAAVEVPAEG
ncbi:TetR/AcrR family transcriptional regulator [Rugosimonospora acidiphila]|uniref:TetR/AcrR family transcriptional regulator n=1 Tax=Rugosimonospora acidiphila TaxID=556531 RepID=A0ABP9SFN5_9ACTN